MTPERHRFVRAYKELHDAAMALGIGDVSGFARSREAVAICLLGHTSPGKKKYAGADAINQQGQEVEYKSTTQATLQGAYTGISVQETWEEQEKYLRDEKILPYEEHYFNRFENGMLVESWVMPGQLVFDILYPKLYNQFHSTSKRKDPRLNARITWQDIQEYGKKVI